MESAFFLSAGALQRLKPNLQFKEDDVLRVLALTTSTLLTSDIG
jgi:hypothetical protein